MAESLEEEILCDFQIKKISRQYTAEQLLNLWQRRPTRLFWLLENFKDNNSQAFFAFLDREIARLSVCFKGCYYKNEQLQQLKELAAKNKEDELLKSLKTEHLRDNATPLASVSIPLVLKSGSNQEFLPPVIFDSFSSNLCSDLVENNKRYHSKASRVEMLFNRSYQTHLPIGLKLPLFNFSFNNFSAAGESFALGLWVELWLRQHRPVNKPFLCCSGNIDCNTGKILEVDDLDLKIKAALNKNFDFVIVPASGLDKILLADNRVLAFSHLDELNYWLMMNSGNEIGATRVRAWLKGERKLPVFDNFYRYFSSLPPDAEKTVADCKTLIRRQSIEQQIEKLEIFVESYIKNSADHKSFINCFLPDFLQFALLPWLLMNYKNLPGHEADALYLHFYEKLLTSQPEVYQASRFVRHNFSHSLIFEPDFFHLRQRYPAILLLFFHEPGEMLHFFSRLPYLTSFELKLLEKICCELDKSAEEYCQITSAKRVDAEIMEKILFVFDSQAQFKVGTQLVMRRRLKFLFEAFENFVQSQQKNVMFKLAAQTCLKLIKMHLQRFAFKNKLDLDSILDFLFHNATLENIDENIRHNPVLNGLLKQIGRKEKNSRLVKKPLKQFKRNLQNKTKDMPWLPQPGLVVVKNLVFNYKTFNWRRVLNSFAESVNLEPSGELMLYCPAHYAGYFTGLNSKKPALIDSSMLPLSGQRFSLAFFSGFALAFADETDQTAISKKNCFVKCNFKLVECRDGFESLFYFLLPQSCQQCMKSQFRDFLVLKRSYKRSQQESIKKNEAAVMMQKALYNNLICSEDFVPERKFWEQKISACCANPGKIRKSLQALLPVYLTLTGDHQKAESLLGIYQNHLNHAAFICEYIKTFYLNFSPLRPINWTTSIEQQTYNSLVIGWLKKHNDKRLNQFLIHCVDDPANLYAAFQNN